MSAKIIWQEPGITNKGRILNDVVRVELQSNPGKWALIYSGLKPQSASPRWRGEMYERAYRTIFIDGVRYHNVYVRFVGSTK